ncbi:EAL domain-containing protein [Sphingomonas sp.]|uniref:EAL domain-containing protein n=1 Tax=Sphingomonas sp. TaxID=28214 RepID=UPI0035C81B41
MDESFNRRVAIHSGCRGGTIAALVDAAGWTVDARAVIAIVDLADGPIEAIAQAVIAVSTLTGSAAAWQAHAAGATHWLAADFGPADVAAALAFAERFVRADGWVRPERRDPVRREDGVLADWLAERTEPVSAIVVVLTRFEFVNAAYGRATGDALMAAAAARIEGWARQALGAGAMLRRAGTEFVLLTDGGVAPDAIAALDRALALPFDAAGTAASLGTRIGTARAAPGDDLPVLLSRARRTLGQPSGPAANDGKLDALAADLHRAIERSEIAIRYQPQVALGSGAILGVEALARWDHPVLGGLGADDLFAAAERADLGNAVSEHIQRRALAEVADWPAALARLRVSVNVTAADLARPGFAEAFLARIDASGVARGRVTAEIVETGLIDDLDRAGAVLARLRGAGCRIAIDDFGTGYSSLAYLKALPIDYLKIDRSLTRDIAGSERDRVIVRGVIAIARSLGMETIAEGVETEAERALLAAEGGDLYQGFLCSEPVDGERLAKLVG